MDLPREVDDYRNAILGNPPRVPPKIIHYWNSRIVPANLYGLREQGAYKYITKYGGKFSEKTLVHYALQAEIARQPDMACGFWKKAYSVQLSKSNSTMHKNSGPTQAKKESSQSPYDESSFQFDVFLCHNSSDKPTIRYLAGELRNRRIAVWLDEWELIPGRPWQEALEKVIQTVMAAAVLVGADGIGPWQDRELRGFLSEFVKRKLPVIPVLLPGAPEKPELPIFLKEFTWVDLRSGISKNGLDRLQWGITGKKPTR